MEGMKYGQGGIIANPNCSTIIALMAVTPLHRVGECLRCEYGGRGKCWVGWKMRRAAAFCWACPAPAAVTRKSARLAGKSAGCAAAAALC